MTINDEKNGVQGNISSMIDSDRSRSDSSFLIHSHNKGVNGDRGSFIISGKPPLAGASTVQRDHSANALRS